MLDNSSSLYISCWKMLVMGKAPNVLCLVILVYHNIPCKNTMLMDEQIRVGYMH